MGTGTSFGVRVTPIVARLDVRSSKWPWKRSVFGDDDLLDHFLVFGNRQAVVTVLMMLFGRSSRARHMHTLRKISRHLPLPSSSFHISLASKNVEAGGSKLDEHHSYIQGTNSGFYPFSVGPHTPHKRS
ncbi:hypothetical protein LSTR_LSTR000038 [Laodelphax striatellus]|uniref:Uncharacterized protein n=1 Tax=Laodelphax striatellus TaxID=195883 RepID=A0A482X6C0_LAOST|nr:hypothetical protein LSTR_LSTR000038 [Laodelphax striatellus]